MRHVFLLSALLALLLLSAEVTDARVLSAKKGSKKGGNKGGKKGGKKGK